MIFLSVCAFSLIHVGVFSQTPKIPKWIEDNIIPKIIQKEKFLRRWNILKEIRADRHLDMFADSLVNLEELYFLICDTSIIPDSIGENRKEFMNSIFIYTSFTGAFWYQPSKFIQVISVENLDNNIQVCIELHILRKFKRVWEMYYLCQKQPFQIIAKKRTKVRTPYD